jgi:hypothetical protein
LGPALRELVAGLRACPFQVDRSSGPASPEEGGELTFMFAYRSWPSRTSPRFSTRHPSRRTGASPCATRPLGSPCTALRAPGAAQYFLLKRVALLAGHRSDVERIVRSRDILDGFLRPAVDPGDPGVRPVRGSGRPSGSRPGRQRRPRPRAPRACEPACHGAFRGEPPPLLVEPPRGCG